VYDITILEADLCEGAANLSTQLDVLNCRKLTQELKPRCYRFFDRSADRDSGGKRSHRFDLGSSEEMRREKQASPENSDRDRRTDPGLGSEFL
jgi:hypothetical protein